MKCIIGEKIGMSQVFDEQGSVVPVTLLHVEPCTVAGKRTNERDGYSAIILASGTRRRCVPSQKGQFKGVNGGLSPKIVSEFRCPQEASQSFEVGAQIDVTSFKPGELISIQGVSKGKGFQGVVKRHHFAGGPASLGHKDNLRMPGSIGSTFPQHIRKGKRMGGRMGSDQVTTHNVPVMNVDAKNHVLAVKGCVPGSRGSLVRCFRSEE